MIKRIISADFSKKAKKALGIESLHRAYFVERPNRFIVHCTHENGDFIRAHLPNPGRLQELFFPGTILYLAKASDQQSKSKVPRRTSYTVIAVDRDGRPIFLHTHHSNTLVELMLRDKLIASLKEYSIIKREAKYGHSRFDFLLQKTNCIEQGITDTLWEHHKQAIQNNDCEGKGLLWLEVKSCTLFGNNVAMFPDAITDRGRRHLEELAKLSDEGVDCAVLFAIHSPEIKYFMPDFHTDLQFSNTLIRLRDKLKIIPLSIPWTKNMSINLPLKEVEVPWKYLESEVCDEGSYLVLSYFKEKKLCQGSGGNIEVEQGCYIYTGFAEVNLEKSIKKLRNKKRKILNSPVDILAKHCDKLVILPIRGPLNKRDQINQDIQKLLSHKVPLFKSETLFSSTGYYTYANEDPLNIHKFHTILEQYRMKHPD